MLIVLLPCLLVCRMPQPKSGSRLAGETLPLPGQKRQRGASIAVTKSCAAVSLIGWLARNRDCVMLVCPPVLSIPAGGRRSAPGPQTSCEHGYLRSMIYLR